MAKGSKAAASAAGMAKSAGKALKGYPGIFHHLAGEHGEVATLLKRISGADARTREDIFPELRKNLLAHAHGEEQEFYPRLREFSELEDLVSRALAQHAEVEQQLERLEGMDQRSDGWMQTFEEMKRNIEAHVDLEENEIFPRANERLSSDQASAMEDRYEQAEEREKAALG